MAQPAEGVDEADPAGRHVLPLGRQYHRRTHGDSIESPRLVIDLQRRDERRPERLVRHVSNQRSDLAACVTDQRSPAGIAGTSYSYALFYRRHKCLNVRLLSVQLCLIYDNIATYQVVWPGSKVDNRDAEGP
jgi:hypothetical protein